MQSISHDLAIISYQSGHCGLASCSRTAAHYHCRFCSFGTSQVGNAVAHGRICVSIELPQKDLTNVSVSSDSLYSSTSQPFPYYPQVSQASASTSKMIATQQSTMFNFVIPSQTGQYGGLYGPQTVFQNPNLFSPSSFANYAQLDSTWMTQSRLLSANIIPASSSPTEGGTRTTNSPSCCRGETAPFGLTPPLPDTFKVTSKEQQPQNWYCSSQNVITQQKYPDSTASSCSIGLLFLEQSKEADECIDVDDLCFTAKTKEPVRSSCMESERKADDSASSCASDIVVEETESDINGEMEDFFPRCMVCEHNPIVSKLIVMTEKYPVTTSSSTSVLNKVSAILDEISARDTFICRRCLDLVNAVDHLEFKLLDAMEELKRIKKTAKEKRRLKTGVDKSLVCQTCDKIFTSSVYLAKHKLHHTTSFSYCCEYCGKGFTDLQKLENHILLHSNTQRFQCGKCGKQFLKKHTLVNHMKQHKEDEKCFVQSSDFKDDIGNQEGTFYICHHCGRKIKTYSNLVVHIKICSGDLKHVCGRPKCGKSFPLKSLLKKHIACKHKNKYKFKCPSCSKGFWTNSDLVSHARTHSNEKPYRCSTCGRCYKSQKNLNHHNKLHDTESNFKCNVLYCGKTFTRAYALEDHMNLHTGKKPFKCLTCSQKFANRTNFNAHVKRHVNGNNSCPVCKKTVMKSLREHMQVHSNDKNFVCRCCQMKFSFKNSMVKHMKLKHSKEINV